MVLIFSKSLKLRLDYFGLCAIQVELIDFVKYVCAADQIIQSVLEKFSLFFEVSAECKLNIISVLFGYLSKSVLTVFTRYRKKYVWFKVEHFLFQCVKVV